MSMFSKLLDENAALRETCDDLRFQLGEVSGIYHSAAAGWTERSESQLDQLRKAQARNRELEDAFRAQQRFIDKLGMIGWDGLRREREELKNANVMLRVEMGDREREAREKISELEKRCNSQEFWREQYNVLCKKRRDNACKIETMMAEKEAETKTMAAVIQALEEKLQLAGIAKEESEKKQASLEATVKKQAEKLRQNRTALYAMTDYSTRKRLQVAALENELKEALKAVPKESSPEPTSSDDSSSFSDSDVSEQEDSNE